MRIEIHDTPFWLMELGPEVMFCREEWKVEDALRYLRERGLEPGVVWK